MWYRTFIGHDLQFWAAWVVRPIRTDRRSRERRKLEDRRARYQPVAVNRRSGLARRMEVRRELAMPPAIAVPPDLADGWVCFARGDDMRRITPVPDDWERCSELKLADLCEAAIPIRRSMARADSSS